MQLAHEMRQKAGVLNDEAKEILNNAEEEGRDLTEEEQEEVDGLLDERDRLKERADALEDRMDRVEANEEEDAELEGRDAGRQAFEGVNVQGEVPGRDSETDPKEVQWRAFRKWLAYGPEYLEGAEGRFVNRRSPDEAEHNFGVDRADRVEKTATEFRASTALQLSSSGPSGGNLVPTEFLEELFEDIEDIGAMRDVADVRRTDTGRDLQIPLKRDNTAQGEFIAEGTTAITNSTNIRYGQTTIGANEVQAGPIKVSWTLRDDSAFDMPEQVRDELAGRISRISEDKFVTGSTGTAKTPTGLNTIYTSSTGTRGVSGGSTALTVSDLQALKYDSGGDGLKEGWRQMDTAWLMSPAAWFDVINLEDADGRPLVNPELRDATEPRLLGDRVVLSDYIDDFGSTGNLPIWYGAFDQAYMVRDVNQLRLVRFDEKFADARRVGFMGWMRVDGQPVFASTQAHRNPIRAIMETA